ncbi:MAG TPA: GNAT family N-acetyltransferase [Polyangia bacterium]|jgi:GNAT superfamily N-acetyltransferase|nr:GNAT family N-acetyltransferase [Polyangia bacterium]
MTIRPAVPGDEASLLSLIRALARFERLEDTVTGSAAALARDLFGARPACEALLAEDGGVAVGYALYFTTYSTFLTKPGLWLEDLFVLESHRRRGVGLALLTEVRRIAEARGCGRFEWSVLDWNDKAIALYERFGATVMPDWRICRVTFGE